MSANSAIDKEKGRYMQYKDYTKEVKRQRERNK